MFGKEEEIAKEADKERKIKEEFRPGSAGIRQHGRMFPTWRKAINSFTFGKRSAKMKPEKYPLDLGTLMSLITF